MMIAIIFLINCPSDNKPSTGSENCKEGEATLCFSREYTNCNSVNLYHHQSNFVIIIGRATRARTIAWILGYVVSS